MSKYDRISEIGFIDYTVLRLILSTLDLGTNL